MFPLHKLDSIKKEYGAIPTLEQMKIYFKKYFENMLGKIVSVGFWATSGDIDKLLGQATANGLPIEPGTYKGQRYQLGKEQIKGRPEEYKKLVETEGIPA